MTTVGIGGTSERAARGGPRRPGVARHWVVDDAALLAATDPEDLDWAEGSHADATTWALAGWRATEEEQPLSKHHHAAAAGEPANPGDDAPPGTPGTGEDVCRVCNGSGSVDGKACANCGGTGKVVEGVGGG